MSHGGGNTAMSKQQENVLHYIVLCMRTQTNTAMHMGSFLFPIPDLQRQFFFDVLPKLTSYETVGRLRTLKIIEGSSVSEGAFTVDSLQAIALATQYVCRM